MSAKTDTQPASKENTDALILALLSSAISISALLFYLRHHAILLYGDAMAHINIARRVFDSRTPGISQLGTVWLPLPHLLNIPFVLNDRLWHSGVGGSILSMVAYVAGVLGIFRLARGMASRLVAWVAALIFALNPNLIYMQATAMTESLYLAFFIWTVVFFSEFVSSADSDSFTARRALEKCATMVWAAMLVRYDGWFLAALVAGGVLISAWRVRPVSTPVRRGLLVYVMLVGATGVLWLVYNYARYGKALEFANGPYSAHAIWEHSKTPTWTSYPGEGSPRTGMLYFLKVSRLTVAGGQTEYLLFAIAFIALLCVFYFARQYLPWTILWYPAIFYMVCIAWGSVPIYFPNWWPFTYYNLRYGLQMLPALALFAALAIDFIGNLLPARRVAAAAVVLLITVLSYASVWRNTPLVLREAQVNGSDRLRFEKELAAELKRLPPGSTLMMDCSAYSGAIQLAGIPFERVLRESNPPYWEIALSRPAQSADYVIAIDRDAVASAVRVFPQNLESIATIGTPRGRHATIYRSVH
jgi:hypothetical protein